MENQSCFDLNTAIENWRQELIAQPPFTADTRRELETHLRDGFAELKLRGLSDEESFWLARRRIGQPRKLAEEFAKTDPARVWRERVFWMWLALFLSGTLGSLGNSLAYMLMSKDLQNSANWLGRMIYIAPILISLLIPIILAIYLAKGKLTLQFSRLMSLLENRLRLAVVVTVCIVLSSVMRLISYQLYLTRMNAHRSAWEMTIGVSVYSLISGLVLIWLMPAEKQKVTKSV